MSRVATAWLHRGLPVLIGFTCCLSVAAAESLEWRFNDAADVTDCKNFTYDTIANGCFRGTVIWDPYLYLRLPQGGFDAAKLRYLEVRLYSSGPADSLDVYYKGSDAEWGLMGKLPIKRGWAVYRMDMTNVPVHECNGSPTSRKWGGASGRIITFRLDPGNEGGRWVMVSRIRLSDEPLTEGVTEEPRGQATLADMRAPATVTSGAAVSLAAKFTGISAPPELKSATAYLRLLRGDCVLAEIERPVDLTKPEAEISASFPTSKWLSGGKLGVKAGIYELDLSPATASGELASIALLNPREGKARPPQVDVRPLAGDPTIHVDGKPLAGMAFLVAGGRFAPLHQEFARAGIHLYTDWFGSSIAGDLGHATEDKYDYGDFDTYFADILTADPQAQFMPHLYVTPPAWWQTKNPAEQAAYAEGGRGPQSFASEKWRREMGEDLRRLIAHLQSSAYADHILGYILCSGYSAEWQEWGIWEGKSADYSEPSRQAFRAWLRGHYATEAALQAAWHDPAATFAAAELPTVAQRTTSAAFALRDPTKEQQVIDFYQYLSETDADAILQFAHIVKQASGGRSLAGAYYGYMTQHWIHQQDSAHLAVEKALSSPDIDFLMSPPMYSGREIGGTSTFMSAFSSVKLHGKLWLNESDIRTYKSDPGADYGRVNSLPDSLAVLRREFGEMLSCRTAISWFDMAGGWFSDPAILADMAVMRRTCDVALARRRPSHSEMAVFISPESAYRMRPSALWMPAVLDQVVNLPRVGVPADVYILPDINRADFPQYKVYVFLNACFVDAETRRSIEGKVKARGATAVWVFAPGAVSGSGLSAEGMSSLTGIHLALDMRAAVLQVTPQAGSSLCRGLPADKPLGWDQENGPIVWADDPAAEVHGVLSANGKPGLVRKKVGNSTSIFYATVGMPPTLLRNIAREAGAHVYLDTGDALNTDGQYACIHAKTAGTKVLRLPKPAWVVDVMTGKVLATGSASVTLRMSAGQTMLMAISDDGR